MLFLCHSKIFLKYFCNINYICLHVNRVYLTPCVTDSAVTVICYWCYSEMLDEQLSTTGVKLNENYPESIAMCIG